MTGLVMLSGAHETTLHSIPIGGGNVQKINYTMQATVVLLNKL